MTTKLSQSKFTLLIYSLSGFAFGSEPIMTDEVELFEFDARLRVNASYAIDSDDFSWVSNASRLSIKGRWEENSYRAFYFIEERVDPFAEDNYFDRRDQYVGVGKDKLNVYFGRKNSAFRQARGRMDYGAGYQQASLKGIMLGEQRYDQLLALDWTPTDLLSFTMQAQTEEDGFDRRSSSFVYDDASLYFSIAHNQHMNTVAGVADMLRTGMQYRWSSFEMGFLAQAAEQEDGDDLGSALSVNMKYRLSNQSIWLSLAQGDQPVGLASKWYDEMGTRVKASSQYILGWSYSFSTQLQLQGYISRADAQSQQGEEEEESLVAFGIDYRL